MCPQCANMETIKKQLDQVLPWLYTLVWSGLVTLVVQFWFGLVLNHTVATLGVAHDAQPNMVIQKQLGPPLKGWIVNSWSLRGPIVLKALWSLELHTWFTRMLNQHYIMHNLLISCISNVTSWSTRAKGASSDYGYQCSLVARHPLCWMTTSRFEEFLAPLHCFHQDFHEGWAMSYNPRWGSGKVKASLIRHHHMYWTPTNILMSEGPWQHHSIFWTLWRSKNIRREYCTYMVWHYSHMRSHNRTLTMLQNSNRSGLCIVNY